MRKRHVAVFAVFALSAASLNVSAAHAASTASTTPTTYYVDSSSPGCSDSGAGTKAAPFCTIQRAASLATVPGDVVSVATGVGYSGEVDITASGTAAAPIIFEASNQPGKNAGAGIYGTASNPLTYGIAITDSSYVKVESLAVIVAATADSVLVKDSSHIAVDSLNVIQISAEATPAIEVDGNSSDVTLSRDVVSAKQSPGIDVDTTGTGNVVTTDAVSQSDSAGISVEGDSGTLVTSNTVTAYCGAGISLSDNAGGSASGATVENNVVASARAVTDCPVTAGYGLELQSSADAKGAVANYNTIYPGGAANAHAYSWAGTTYDTPAAFFAATGQGSADSAADPGLTSDGTIAGESSPLINAANSSAPGELATDAYNAARVYDPNVKPTGAGTYDYYDRGAFQYAEQVTLANGFADPADHAGEPASVIAGTASSNWAGATFSYIYDFGDGTVDHTPGAADEHRYMNPGQYTITVTAVSDYGGTTVETFSIYIGPPDFILDPQMTAVGALGIQAGVSAGGPAPMLSETVDFGDGTGTFDILNGPTQHTYSKPGTYTLTFSGADSHDDSQTTTTTFTTAGGEYTPYGPTRLLDTRSGLGGTAAQLQNDGSIKLKVAGNGSIPGGVTAVALNLTAVNATGNGYIQAGTGTNSGTSNLNYGADGIFSNSVIAPVAADGTVTLANFGGSTSVKLDLIADVSGYFAPATASGYTPLTPARVMDTRTGLGGSKGKLAAKQHDVLTITGADSGGLPATGVTAVALNLTETDTSVEGFLAAYPDGTAVPNVSAEDWIGSTTKAVTVIVPVGADGKIDVYNGSGNGGSADVVADVVGYFSASGAGLYVPLTPDRVLDTRKSGGPVAANSATTLDFSSAAAGAGITSTATAYVLNTTVTQTNGAGWLAVVPFGSPTPTTSSLNWNGPGATVANLTLATPDAGGEKLSFYNGGGPVSRPAQVVADVMGYFSTS